MGVTCVVLAAGASRRMGSDKLSQPLADGSTLMQRAMRACAGYPAVVVTSSALAATLEPPAGVTVVLNDEPERGMTHSLRLADERIWSGHSIAVLPADLPLANAATMRTVVEASGGVDVCYPVRANGTPGHPVVFSPEARKLLGELPEGDTLRALRENPALSRRALPIEDDAPYLDVDEPDDLRRWSERT